MRWSVPVIGAGVRGSDSIRVRRSRITPEAAHSRRPIIPEAARARGWGEQVRRMTVADGGGDRGVNG